MDKIGTALLLRPYRLHGLNYQKLGKQLMTEDEIAVMDGGKCILQLRGVRPFFSDKYDITKHPNYKYLSDYDKKNTFDMEKHLRRRPALPALTRDSPLVLGIALERLKQNDSRNDKKMYFRYGI